MRARRRERSFSFHRARASLLAAVACILLATAGCGRARVPPLVVGPIVGAPSPDSFERLVQAARSLGYDPQRVDLVTGTFHVVSHHAERGVRQDLQIQIFASGHVMVVPTGARVRHSGTQYIVPPGLRDELLVFVDGLAAGAGVSQR